MYATLRWCVWFPSVGCRSDECPRRHQNTPATATGPHPYPAHPRIRSTAFVSPPLAPFPALNATDEATSPRLTPPFSLCPAHSFEAGRKCVAGPGKYAFKLTGASGSYLSLGLCF